MGNLKRKNYESCSDVAKYIINTTDNWIDERPGPIVVFDVDPSVDEACEAIKYIVDSGWMNGMIYAKKMVHTYLSYNNIRTTKICIVITDNEKDFDNFENGEHTYFRSLNTFPEIVGVPINVAKKGILYDGDVYLKTIDGNMSILCWEHKNNMQLEKNDHVLLYFDQSKKINHSIIQIGTYTGVNMEDQKSKQTLYEIKTTNEKFFCPRGINNIGKRFITLPEYKLIVNTHLEANEKATELFDKLCEKRINRKK